MKKNIRYKKDVKNRTGLMLFLLFTCFTLCLSVGYAALNSDLKISGEASFRVESDIRITDVSLYETANLAVENYTSKYSKDTVTIGTKLTQVNSTISYKVKVQNSGTVAMWIDSIEEEAKNNSNTEYVLEGIGLKELINPGEEKEFIVKIKYKNNITTLPDNTNLDTILKFNFIKPESTLASGSNTNSASTFFNGPLKKEEIESIEFRPTLDVIEDAIGSWDASAPQNGTVIASYKDSDGNGLYELYIGGIGKVNAPIYANNLFNNFTKVKQIDFDKYFNTSGVKTMSTMFGNCKSITNLDLSNFNTKDVAMMISMFLNCSKLSNLNLSSFDTSSVASMESMFNGCYSLAKLDLSNFDTSKVTSMRNMFLTCSGLSDINLSSFTTSNVVSMVSMFHQCNSLVNLDLSNFNTSKVTDMQSMFNGCKSLKNINLSSFDTSNVVNIHYMFSNCSSLMNLNITNFNTSNVKNARDMFSGCSSLTNLDITNFNTSNMTNMTEMFRDCTLLENLNLSNFDTSNTINMKGMFKNCVSLTSLNLNSFNTENVTDMSEMFHFCQKIKSLDLTTFDTSKVTTMRYMFYYCLALEDLNLSSFDTSNVADMYFLFWGDKSLNNIDLSSFNFTNVTDSSRMFYSVPSDSLIYVKDDISKEFILTVRSDLTNVQIKEV